LVAARVFPFRLLEHLTGEEDDEKIQWKKGQLTITMAAAAHLFSLSCDLKEGNYLR
jgi:hypothetical protein